MEAAVEAEAAQHQVQHQQVEQVQRVQSLSTGKKPNPEDLDYKLYAVVKDNIVLGSTWEIPEVKEDGLEFVLMTFDNSPAFTGGTYKNGKFYQEKEQ